MYLALALSKWNEDKLLMRLLGNILKKMLEAYSMD